MYAYLNLLLNICLFKKGPQDIPCSAMLLRLSILAYGLISYLLIQLSANNFKALLQVATEIIITIVFTGLMLTATKKISRFVQTACSLFGTDALISLCAMPVIASLTINSANTLALFAMLAMMIWHWLVTAHIIRHAINQTFTFSLGLAFLYIFSAYQIISVLFPSISPSS